MKLNKKKILFIFLILFFLWFFCYFFISINNKSIETVKLTYSNSSNVNKNHVSSNHLDNIDYGFTEETFSSSDMIADDLIITDNASENSSESYDYTNDVSSDNVNLTDGKKLKKTYKYSVETDDYSNFTSKLSSEISSLGGYIESSDEVQRTELNSNHTQTYTVRQNTYLIRVPSDKMQNLLKMVSGSTYIISKNESIEDVTAQYIDLDTHIQSLKEEYKTLNDLLKQAETVTETIEIQDRLSSINYEIESYENCLDLLKEDIEFSKLYLTVNEVIYYQDTVRRFTSDISESWYDVYEDWICDVLPIILLLTISAIPFMIIVALFVFLISKIILKNKSKYKQTLILEQESQEE